MAEQLSSGGKGSRKKKDADQTPGPGHNMKEFEKLAEGFYARLDNLNDDRESANGEFMADIKNVLEEAANALGVPRKIVRTHYNRRRRLLKEEKADRELEASEVEALERLEAAFSGTPMGDLAAAKKGAAQGKTGEEAFDEE